VVVSGGRAPPRPPTNQRIEEKLDAYD
jgi:hypothetical protein